MLLVLAYHDKSAPLMLRQLYVARKLDSKLNHNALLSRPSGVSCVPLEQLAADLFNRVEHHVYDDPYASEPAPWPQPQNWAWAEAARHVAAIKDEHCWFWWEHDVTPIAPGWADSLQDLYLKHNRPFLGAFVHGLGGHMNGVAVYPMNVASYTGAAPFLTRDRPFDIIMSGSLRKEDVADETSRMFHYPRLNGACCRIESESVVNELRKRGYLILHGVNDESLTSLMLDEPMPPVDESRLLVKIGLAQLKNKVDHAEVFHQYDSVRLAKSGWNIGRQSRVRRHVPSLFAQGLDNGFQTGTFPLPLNRLECWFNPTIALGHDNRIHFVARRWLRLAESSPVWTSTLHRTVIDDKTNMGEMLPLPFGNTKRGHQREDPRLIYHNGGYYVGFVEWQHYADKFLAHQGLLLCDMSWRPVRQYDIQFGGNGPKLGIGKGHEKNWLWFYNQADLYLLYSFNPHVLTRVSGNQRHEVHQTDPGRCRARWRFGEIRGGTPPVRVADEYITFFHSSLWWKGRQKRYYMGAYAFKAEPPFPVTRITSKPILIASEEESRTLGGPLCIFPGGAVLQDGMWLIVYGINDEQCGWAKIPHETVDRSLS